MQNCWHVYHFPACLVIEYDLTVICSCDGMFYCQFCCQHDNLFFDSTMALPRWLHSIEIPSSIKKVCTLYGQNSWRVRREVHDLVQHKHSFVVFPQVGDLLNRTGKPILYNCIWPVYQLKHGRQVMVCNVMQFPSTSVTCNISYIQHQLPSAPVTCNTSYLQHQSLLTSVTSNINLCSTSDTFNTSCLQHQLHSKSVTSHLQLHMQSCFPLYYLYFSGPVLLF